MPHTAEAVLSQLKQRQYQPVYFLQGDEAFYIDQISDYIEKNALQPTERDFNHVVLYGKDTDMATVLSNARRFPMMAERQVVIVKEAQVMLDLEQEKGIQMLEAYLNKPLPSTVLVFCYKYSSLDGRKSLAKTLDKKAVLVTTKKVYDNQLPAWVGQYVKEKSLKINAATAQLLADFVGADLSRLASEIDKIAINKQPQETITDDEVHKNVGISKEYNIFELQTALTNKDALKANRILAYFEANPKAGPAIANISILFGFYSKLLLLYYLRRKGLPVDARAMAMNDYGLKQLTAATSRITETQAYQAIRHLKKADLQAKGIESAALPDAQIMKELVFKLLHGIVN